MSRQALISLVLLLLIVWAAVLSRLALTETESRKQILAFWVLAVTVEALVKPTLRLRSNLWMAILTGLCVTCAIVSVRWYLKGFCPHTWPQCRNPILDLVKSFGI
ncbi:hypothetical protein [Novosphingobium chloroacetimidivorans]|nr:hypothetical protein [Novosphingobium chloroacetimidivorans]